MDEAGFINMNQSSNHRHHAGPRLLIVEDEAQQRDFYQHIFENVGWRYRIACNGANMRRLCRQQTFDAIVLDLRLPDVDGLFLLREYRQHSTRPVLVVSVRDSAEERAACFHAGATDFMIKPFRPSELLHRLRQMFTGWQEKSVAKLPVFGLWQFSSDQQLLFSIDGKSRRLTLAESNLLQLLINARGRTLSGAWLQESLELTHRKSVDTLVYRLRQKIEPNPRQPVHIITVPSRGYCLLD